MFRSTLTEIYSYLGFVCFLLCCVSPSNGTAGKISHLLKDRWSEQRQEPFIKTESLKVKFRMACCLSCPFICLCEQLQNVSMVPSEMSRKHQKPGFWAWKGADLKVLGLSTFNLGMEVTCLWKWCRLETICHTSSSEVSVNHSPLAPNTQCVHHNPDHTGDVV